MRNLISNLIFLLLVAIPLGMPVWLFQEISWTNKLINKYSAAASQYENEFRQNADQFIENAGNAGTTKIAQSELAKSMSWLQSKYPKDRFEYKDLEVDLKTLEKLPVESVLPLSIKQSIKKDLELITNTVNEQAANIYKRGNFNLHKWYMIESFACFFSLTIASYIAIFISKKIINYFEKD